MNKNVIQVLSDESKIHPSYFPIDLYYLSERIGNVTSENVEAPNIKVADIGYSGGEKNISTSPISLCINPALIIRNEK